MAKKNGDFDTTFAFYFPAALCVLQHAGSSDVSENAPRLVAKCHEVVAGVAKVAYEQDHGATKHQSCSSRTRGAAAALGG